MAHTSICWIVPFALCATVGAQGVADADGANPKRVEEALYKFKRLMPRTQKSIVTKVRAAVDAVEDDYLKSVRHYIEVGRTLSSKSKLKTRQKKTKIVASPGWRQHVPFPVEREYAFGFDKTFTVDPLGKKTICGAPSGRYERGLFGCDGPWQPAKPGSSRCRNSLSARS